MTLAITSGTLDHQPTSYNFLESYFVNENFTSDTGQFTTVTGGTIGSFAVGAGVGTITNTSGANRETNVLSGTAPTTNLWQEITITARSGAASYDVVGLGICQNGSNLILAEYSRMGTPEMRITVRIGGSQNFRATVTGMGTLAAPYKLAFSIFGNIISVYREISSVWTLVTSYDVSATIDLTATDLSTWKCAFALASATNDTSVTSFDDWKSRVEIDYRTPDAGSSLRFVDEQFVSDSGQFTNVITGGSFTVGSGVGTITHGAGALVDLIRTGSSITMPQVFVSADITQAGAQGGTFGGVGIVKDSNNFILAVYSNSSTYIRVNDAGSITDNSSFSVTLTSPGKIGLSIVGNSACVWFDRGNGWECGSIYNFSSLINLKAEDFATWYGCFYLASSSAATWTYDNFRVGRFGAVGIRDQTVISTENNMPYILNDKLYFTASCPDPAGTSYSGIFTLDLTTYAMSQLSVIMVSRSSSVQNDHASHMLIMNNGDQHYLVSSWGNGFNGVLEVLYKLVASGTDLLSGSHVISSMSTLALARNTGVSSGRYDPFLYLEPGNTYLVAYTEVDNTNFVGDPFYACLDRTSDLSVFTGINNDNANKPFEGTKMTLAGGRPWVIACGTTTARIYDGALNFIALLNGISDGAVGLTLPHQMTFPYKDDIWLITFDKTKFNSNSFTWGKIRIGKTNRFRA